MTTTPPRVLFVASDLDGHGGIQRYSRGLAESLSRLSTLHVVDLHLDGSVRHRLAALARVAGASLQHRPDLVVLGHVGMGAVGRLGQLLGRPYAVVAYGVEIWGEPSRTTADVLAHADAVWPISHFTGDQVARRHTRARLAEPLGASIGPQFFDVRPAPASPMRVVVVATGASPVRYKGIDTTMRALASLDEEVAAELRVVGRADERELDRLRRDYGGPALFTPLGVVDDHELLEEYRRATVVVLVSRFKAGREPMGEGLGLVLIEAAAASVPAIGSSVGGCRDAVVDGTTGFLVDPDDPAELADRLRWLLVHPDERAEMGRRAHDWARSTHSPEAFDRRVAAAVEVALKGKG